MADLSLFSFETFGDLINRMYIKNVEQEANTMLKSGLVMTDNITKGTWKTRRHKEVPHREIYAKNRSEGAQIASADIQEGYEKDTESRGIALSVNITLDMRENGKNQEILRELTDLSSVIPARRDLNLAMHISFATATSYTDLGGETIDVSVGDGLSLANTTHTLTGSTTTYRNRLAGNPRVSRSSLENMERMALDNAYNNLGEQVASMCDVLWSTDDPNTVNTIRQYLKSTADLNALNAGVVNPYKGRFKHTICGRIDRDANGNRDATKKYYWGLANSRQSSFYEDVYIQPFFRNPSQGNNGEDIQTLDWTFTAGMNHGSVIVDGRFFQFSSGDGTA